MKDWLERVSLLSKIKSHYRKIALVLDGIEAGLLDELGKGSNARINSNVNVACSDVEMLKSFVQARSDTLDNEKDPLATSAESLGTILDRLRSLMSDREMRLELSNIPFAHQEVSRAHLTDALTEFGPTIYDALENLERLIFDFRHSDIIHPTGIRSLERVLPGQKLSPVQFAIKENKIVILQQPATADVADSANIQRSRDTLRSKGLELIQELQRSNCDRRLLQVVTELQSELESQQDIIRLGLTNIGCEAMCAAFGHELPDAICGMMLGHTRGVAMYVAQYPDWQRFTENASLTELEHDDIKRISDAAKSVVKGLEAHPEIADAEVPRTIKAILDLVKNPGPQLKRTLFALLRTVENLLEKAFRFAVDVVAGSFEKSKSPLTTIGAKIIVLTIALGGAAILSPLGTKVAETAWIKAAEDIAKAQLEKLTP